MANAVLTALQELDAALTMLQDNITQYDAASQARLAEVEHEMQEMREVYSGLKQATARVSKRLIGAIDRMDSQLEEYADAA